MWKVLSGTIATILLLAGTTGSVAAAPAPDITGTWVLNLTIDGAPPCQCIEITTFRQDGRLEGPANDHFTGDARGVWAKASPAHVQFRVVQNNINPDGSAGGLYDIACRFTFDGADAGHGTCDGSLVDNVGTTLGTFTSTFTGKRVRISP